MAVLKPTTIYGKMAGTEAGLVVENEIKEGSKLLKDKYASWDSSVNKKLVDGTKAETQPDNTNDDRIATTKFVYNVLKTSDAMRFRGVVDRESTDTSKRDVPSTGYEAGDTYKVGSAGKYVYGTQECEVGDMIICLKDLPQESGHSANDWTVVQTNIDGAVTGPANALNENIAVFDGTTGKVIKDSGYSPSSFASSGHTHTFMGAEATITPTVTATGSFSGTGDTITSSYTPSGTISVASEGETNYTPAGNVSVTPIVEMNTVTVNSITGVGTLPELTMTYTENTKSLSISFSQGTLPTQGGDTTVATGIKSASATGSFSGKAARLIFTGTEGSASATYTPAGSVSVSLTVTGATYTPEGSIN